MIASFADSDFVCVNEHICDTFNLDDITKQMLNKSLLEDLGISTLRYSEDKCKIDNYGKRLLSLCKSLDIHIANGRLGKDNKIGSVTCKNTSVVDYCILSPELFSHVVNFEILPFDPLLSDVHSVVCVEFISKPVKNDSNHSCSNEPDMTAKSRTKWKKEHKELFIDTLDANAVFDLDNRLTELASSDLQGIDQQKIDSLVFDCNKIMLDAASSSDMFVNNKHTRKNNEKAKKPWFTADCNVKRRNYFKARNLHCRIRSAENRQNLIRCSKIYKKEINKQFHAYRKDFIAKLRDLQTRDPKAYWSLLNKTNSSGKNTVEKVALETFYDHFKNLNMNNADDNQDFYFDNKHFKDEQNVELNKPFSPEDITRAIKSLKNNKSCGNDLILNEFLKCSESKMLNIFCKLFNVVFDSGIIPVTWTEGIICPIYKNKGDAGNPDNYRGITILSCFGKLFTAALNNRLDIVL